MPTSQAFNINTNTIHSGPKIYHSKLASQYIEPEICRDLLDDRNYTIVTPHQVSGVKQIHYLRGMISSTLTQLPIKKSSTKNTMAPIP
jgi:hypothetical protein